MDKERLFKSLKRQTKSVLLELLDLAYCEMNTDQRRSVFGDLMKEIKPSRAAGVNIIQEAKEFYEDSLTGMYYAPFNINSKNYSYIPEETEQWFDKLNDLLLSSTQLYKQNNYIEAVESFTILYELIGKMEDGEEIVFADEYGSWMIPGDEKEYLHSFILSLAKTKTPEEYVQATIPLIRRDSYVSFVNKVYSIAIKASNKEQEKCLQEEIENQNIKTKSTW